MEKVTLQAVLIWLLLALTAGAVGLLLYRRGKLSFPRAAVLPALAFYLCFILTITLFARGTVRRDNYELTLFWSYRFIREGHTKIVWEVFWNVVLFLPFGALLGVFVKRMRPLIVFLLALLFSAGIELTQLLTHRGIFEFDDLFHNTLGALIGLGLFLLLRRVARCRD